MIGSIRSTSRTRTSVDEGKFKKLGPALGAWEYYSRGDAEFAASTRPCNPEEVELRPGEILITKKVPVMDGGSRWEDISHHLAYPVPPGTFNRELAKRERRRKPTERPPRPTDVLAALPSMHRRDPLRITTERPAVSATMGALKARVAAEALAKNPNAAPPPVTEPPLIEVGGHAGIERTPQAYAQWLADRGVTLSVTRGGHLLVTSAKPLHAEERALIELAEELLVGYLTGKPVRCSACDATAVSVAFPRTPLCDAHLLEADR